MHVTIHPSQYPGRVRADLVDSLRRREIKHKFHYESYKQAQKWLALHEAHSPARNDPECERIYSEAFRHIAATGGASSASLATGTGTGGASSASPDRSDWQSAVGTNVVHIIGLGCGGGQKDVALLQHLKSAGAKTIYTAVDVSLPLVITARQHATPLTDTTRGLVCDLEMAHDISDELCECSVSRRILTFYGMMPNSEPETIVPRLAALVARGDRLLVSANLAPGTDYMAGVRHVLPQYHNPLTADWLLTFLYDMGVERGDGEIQFSIEECSNGLLRIRADFQFAQARTLRLDSETFAFQPGESIRLFFSYRYTPGRLREIFGKYGLRISEEWIAPSGEEGVFLI